MSLHSIPRPLMGSKATSFALSGSPVVIPPPIVVVESPKIHKARFVGLESSEAQSAPVPVFEGNPCFLRVVNESPGGEEPLTLNYRLMLRGNPAFPAGIEIHRGVSIPNSGETADQFPRGLCMEPGERVELEVLANDGAGANGGPIPTTATLVKVLASFCDFPHEIVRTKRTLLKRDVFVDIVPPPPTGGQNSVISRSDGTAEYSFFANQNAAGKASASNRLNDDGATVFLGKVGLPNPIGSPFVNGTVPMAFGKDTSANASAGVTLEQGMSVQSSVDLDGDVIALTTWMEISAPST